MSGIVSPHPSAPTAKNAGGLLSGGLLSGRSAAALLRGMLAVEPVPYDEGTLEELETGGEEGAAPAGGGRKDKSLGLLCDNFLQRFASGSGGETVELEAVAASLGVGRRRICAAHLPVRRGARLRASHPLPPHPRRRHRQRARVARSGREGRVGTVHLVRHDAPSRVRREA